MTLTDELRNYAGSRGVDLVGCTPARPLKVGDNGEPFDPHRFLPNARCCVVAACYVYGFERPEPSRPGSPRGKFGPWTRASLAAWHYGETVVKEFLERRGYKAVLANEIPYKVLAVRSGIACYGKNSIVHADGYGSYLKLAGVITDAELDCVDRPTETSDCGDCTACVEACPTGALQQPYRLRWDRCITAWLWGMPIERSCRPMIGNYIFRCGFCQDACPKNEHLKPRGTFPFGIESKADCPELIPLLLGEEAYLRRTLPAFVLEAGIDTVRRNVAVALGNSGDPAAAAALSEALRAAPAKVRAAAAWALGRLRGKEAVVALERAIHEEKEDNVRREIGEALRAVR